MQANTWTLCNTKVKVGKHGTLASTYMRLKKEYRSSNNVKYEFWFCHDDIKHFINGNIEKIRVAMVCSIQHMIGEKIYQSLKAKDFGTRRCWVPIAAEGGNLSFYFARLQYFQSVGWILCALNPDFYPISKFGRTMLCNLTILTANHKNKWESTELMDGF